MCKNFYFLLLLILGISCTNPTKKQKTKEENFQKKEIAILDQLEFSGNPQMIIKTAEEYKQYAKKIKYDYGIFRCNMSLIFAFNASSKYKEATLIGKENDVLINKIKADYFVCLNYTNVASSYSYLGLLDEAENCLNKALVYNEKLKKGNDKYYSLGVIYSGFAFVEGMKGEPSPNLDKLQKSYLKQLWALLQVSENNKKMTKKKNAQLAMLYLNLGITSNELKNPQEAESYFHKALDICRKYKFTNNTPLFANTAIAQLFLDQKKYDSCIVHAQKGIILEKKSHSPEIRRDLFQILYKSSVAKGDRETSEKYTNLYMALNDSMMNAEKRGINTPVKIIIENKEKEKTNTVRSTFIVSAVTLLVLTLTGWTYWRRKNKLSHKKYEELIAKIREENTQKIERKEFQKLNDGNGSKSLVSITDETTKSILQKLGKFEMSDKFLKKNINLPYLAGQLNTNTTYLSEIIKIHREKSFNDYINGLRISYITHKLVEDPRYREYKITYLAEECGFASSQVFVIHFKKITGFTPSYFIGNLKKDKNI
ncbi:AraC family transcriptional regulator [Chryseobacterium sp. AG844]|uniref:AraC family transcriptional regulator n=1 Tax=Chryseobacterium sp. AG844 TaxID=2183998 RepID=UPI000D714A69|nr:AraC family transcriptional regulator [Chryseobacterium sp. AG844]PWW20134.1 tetratricopeptide repeat protein [Chryseobacterium sp. AG844]